MYKFILGILITLNCCVAPSSHAATTIDEAASSALHEIMPTSLKTQMEYMGAIYELDGEYFATEPQTSKETASVTIKIRFPAHAKFVALFHTHPGTEEAGDTFSECDINVATQLNVPSYIGITRSNTIRRFIPHVDHIIPVFTGADTTVKSAMGQVI